MHPSGHAPLSFAQERLWFVEQLERNPSLHSLPYTLLFRGDLAIPVLAASLGEIVRRHEALRTRFQVRAGRPVQVIDAGWRPRLRVVDAGGLPGERGESEIDRLMVEEERIPFDLEKGELLRTTLIAVPGRGPGDYVLLLTFHHLVADGWSMGVFLNELREIYSALCCGEPPRMPELPLQYADFVLWQREWLKGEVLERQLGYWREKLSGLQPLDLPADRPAVAGQGFRADYQSFTLREREIAWIDAFRRQGVSPFMVLLAAFQALLQRHTGQSDVAVGAPIANRTHPEVEGLIGLFVNTLVLRTEVGGKLSFQELLERVQETTLGAYDHQDLPFARLVEELRPDRRQGSLPLVDVMLTLESGQRDRSGLPGVELTVIPYRQGAELRIDAALSLHFFASEGRLLGWLGYNTARFDRATAARWRDHFLDLLAAAAAAPERPIGELPLLGGVERHQVLERPLPTSPARTESVAGKRAALESRRKNLSATKRELLDRLLSGEVVARPVAERKEPSILVQLHSGSAGVPPLFLVHAMGGAVFSYGELARRLASAQTLYGVQAPALDGGALMDDLPAMAAAYVDEIERTVPSGPCLLGGWSFGGVVAFEMARQLQARGREVALLALLDSWTPALVDPPAEVSEEELRRLFVAEQAGLAGRSPDLLATEPMQAVLEVYRANLRAYATYRPQLYAGPLTLFRPALATEAARLHPTNGWEACAEAPIEVHTVPGDHHSMLAPPHVRHLAERLGRSIGQALRSREIGAVR